MMTVNILAAECGAGNVGMWACVRADRERAQHETGVESGEEHCGWTMIMGMVDKSIYQEEFRR